MPAILKGILGFQFPWEILGIVVQIFRFFGILMCPGGILASNLKIRRNFSEF